MSVVGKIYGALGYRICTDEWRSVGISFFLYSFISFLCSRNIAIFKDQKALFKDWNNSVTECRTWKQYNLHAHNAGAGKSEASLDTLVLIAISDTFTRPLCHFADALIPANQCHKNAWSCCLFFGNHYIIGAPASKSNTHLNMSIVSATCLF